MKKKYFTCIMLMLLLSGSFSHAAELPEIEGAIAGMNIGMGKLDVSHLNSKLSRNGFPSITDNYAFLGFEGYGIINNWLLGGEGFGITVREADLSSTDSEMHISGAAVLVKGGYIVYEKNSFRVYPTAGIGYGNLQLAINRKEDLTLDEILNGPEGYGFVTVYGALLDVSIGVSHAIEKERKGHYSGIMIGANIGYMHSFGMDFNGTDVGISGPYVNLTVGAAFTDKGYN